MLREEMQNQIATVGNHAKDKVDEMFQAILDGKAQAKAVFELLLQETSEKKDTDTWETRNAFIRRVGEQKLKENLYGIFCDAAALFYNVSVDQLKKV